MAANSNRIEKVFNWWIKGSAKWNYAQKINNRNIGWVGDEGNTSKSRTLLLSTLVAWRGRGWYQRKIKIIAIKVNVQTQKETTSRRDKF